jgi:branched-chain amino acid transport system ATP-binding protein
VSDLEAIAITKRYGGLLAVDDVWLNVPAGAIVALIGPNGAGKTTLFNCLTGHDRPDRGRVRLDGTDVTDWDTYRRARFGLGRTFQRLEVFTRMTVLDNLLVAAEAALPGWGLKQLLSVGGHRDDPRLVGAAMDILEQLGLADRARAVAGDLPTGMLRLVELGRALAAHPRILLLDEPGSGLDQGESDQLRDVLREVAASGVGVLLIEHDIDLVMAVSERVSVMDFGSLIAEGSPAEIAADPKVQAAYLGTPA